MSYNVMSKNPLIQQTSDVVVEYDNTKDQFWVRFTQSGSAYSVNRGELIGDSFKYSSEVIGKILSKLPEDKDLSVLLTNRAENSISLVCEANRRMY